MLFTSPAETALNALSAAPIVRFVSYQSAGVLRADWLPSIACELELKTTEKNKPVRK
jgi:hypothetical protein